MGYYTVIAENGTPHAACKLHYSGHTQWYGFRPQNRGELVGIGLIDKSDRTSYIKYYITFQLDDGVIKAAISAILDSYHNQKYVLGFRDCVNLAADLSRKCGLIVPRISITPEGLLEVLRISNQRTIHSTNLR